MTLECQFSLFPEGSDQMRSSLHGLEAIASELADFANAVQAKVGDLMFLEIGPDRLDRIEFGSVGRQACNGDVAIQLLEPGLDLATAMGGDAVPDDQQRPLNLSLERAQEFDYLFGVDGSGEKAEIELPKGKSGDRRQLLPIEAVLQYGCVPAQTPGTSNAGTFAQPRFVDEDNGTTFSLGFFLSAGQVCRFQWAISASLRWMARFSGFWQEKPIRRSRCHR